MTSFPLKDAAAAAEAFVSVSEGIQRAGHRPPRQNNWAKGLLKSLMHAGLAAAMVSWSARGYFDKIDQRQQRQEDREEATERRLDSIDQRVEHVGQRLDDVLLKR